VSRKSSKRGDEYFNKRPENHIKNQKLVAGKMMESTQSSISRIQPAQAYRYGGLGSLKSSAPQSSQADSGLQSLRSRRKSSQK